MRFVVMSAACALTLGCAATAVAQPPAPITDPVSRVLQNGWNGAKRNLKDSAEQMPESNYGFKPVDTVRTFGEILAHVAGANYGYCSAAKGEKTPYEEDYFEKSAKTKTDIVKAVNDSIAYCDPVYSALTDATVGEIVTRAGSDRKFPRVSPLMSNIGHVTEHYGNLVTYFRIKGMVPPSTARETRR